MKKNLLTMAAVAGFLLFANCGDDNKNNPNGPNEPGDEPVVTDPIDTPPTYTGRPGHDDEVPAGAIEIATFADLCKIGKDFSFPLNANYVLTADIDASESRSMNFGEGFEPIGTSASPFVGGFYGKGHTVSDLYINRRGSGGGGMFSIIGSDRDAMHATISGVHLVNASITGGSGNGTSAAIIGGLVDRVETYGSSVSKSSISGTVTSDDGYATGGLIGMAVGTVTDCYSVATVSSSDVWSKYVGGLVGLLTRGTISRSYARRGVVSSRGDYVGGLAGSIWNGSTIINSYSWAPVSNYDINNSEEYGSSRSLAVGGLVGLSRQGSAITNSYSSGRVMIRCNSGNTSCPARGGLIGEAEDGGATITSSYWDTENSGVTTSAGTGAVGKTSDQMRERATYVGWDFINDWFANGQAHPYLRSIGHPATEQ